MIGVLSIDSSGMLAESALSEDDAVSIALQASEALARLLILGKIVPDGDEGV